MTLEEFANKFPDQITYLRQFSLDFGLQNECEQMLEAWIENIENISQLGAWDLVSDVLHEWDI